MRLSESSNGAAPGRCAHHPGITPGGVICGDRDNSPMGRGVRVAGPRVPAGTLIWHRPGRCPGMILRGDVISPVRQATLPRQGLIGDGARVFSRRTVSQRPGNSGPSTPVRPAATRYAPQHPLKRTGLPLGEPIWCTGDGRARTKDIPARIRSAGAPSVPGICQKGQWSQVTCAPVVVAHCWSWLVFPKPEGSHQEHPRLASGLEPLEQAARCTRAGWAGARRSAALGRTCPLRSDETAPPGGLGCRTSGSRRRRIHPAAGDR